MTIKTSFKTLCFLSLSALISCALSPKPQPIESDFASRRVQLEDERARIHQELSQTDEWLKSVRRFHPKEFAISKTTFENDFSTLKDTHKAIESVHKHLIQTYADQQSLDYAGSDPSLREKNQRELTEQDKELKRLHQQFWTTKAKILKAAHFIKSIEITRIQHNLQISIERAQQSLDSMKQTLEQENALQSAEQSENRDKLAQILMNYNAKAAQYSMFSREIKDLTLGLERFDSLNPEWPKLEKTLNQCEQLHTDLKNLNDSFLALKSKAQNLKSRTPAEAVKPGSDS